MPAVISAFKKQAAVITEGMKKRGVNKIIKPSDLAAIFKEFHGRCAYCSVACIPNGMQRSTRCNFTWYIPLKRGGKEERENLVPTCTTCSFKYGKSSVPRETIPDVNTFGDLVESLVQSIITTTRLKSDNNVEAFRWEEKTNRIKRSINALLENIMISMQYRPFKDWEVDEHIILEEGVNTIPDMIEDVTEKVISQEPVDKEKLNDSVKQMLETKQYKIIRKGS